VGSAVTPVPDKAALVEPPPALWLITMDAVFWPALLGLNVTVTVQDPLGTILLAVQVCVAGKSVVVVTELTVSGAVPEFLTVIVCGELVVLTVCDPKLKVDGVNAIAGADSAVPVPERLTLADPPAALWLIVKVADLAPADTGLNETLMVQAEFGARLATVQVWVPGNWPLSVLVTELTTSEAVPVFRTVITWAELIVFTAWEPKLTLVGVTEIAGVLEHCPSLKVWIRGLFEPLCAQVKV
jgi:hypothetical protein